MKIYTRNGDGGFTSLFGGSKVSKTDIRLEAYGHADELNSLLGWALVEISILDDGGELAKHILKIQSTLFSIGSRLATDNADTRKNLAEITDAEVKALEIHIDKMNEDLAELKNFILPGGTESASRLHICRTMSRRLERAVLHFYKDNSEADSNIMAYLNRISDFLFVAARFANHLQNQQDVAWINK